MSIDASLLLITIGFATPCVAIAMRTAASANRRQPDTVLRDRSACAPEQRLMDLTRRHEELAASVEELKRTVQLILSRLK